MTVKRILVIDDEADIREIARMSLALTTNWEVWTAATSEEGIEIAAQQCPDAILLDVMMPGMDGLATLKVLQNKPTTKNIPVLLLTAAVRATAEQKYDALGATAVLTKPFDPGKLSQQIKTALNW